MPKAKKYSNIKYRLGLVGIIFNLAFLVTTQLSGLSKNLQNLCLSVTTNQFLAISLYILILGIIYYIIDFPLSLYSSFLLEHRFKLTQQKFSSWLKDQFKALLISYLIAIILIPTLYFLIRNLPDSWWLITSLAWILFSFVFGKLFPILIIPLFFKYQPIKEGELKQRILNLADKFKIKLLDVFEIDLSKKTLKANAAFVGFGKTKRVILADTLKEKYSLDEIEAILAHEFAHYKFRHLWKMFGLNALGNFILFCSIFKLGPPLARLYGIESLANIETLPIVLILMSLFSLITMPLTNYIYRILEKQADLEAIKLTQNTQAFVTMINKLAEQNLADRNPGKLVKIFFFDHPSIAERINYVTKKNFD